MTIVLDSHKRIRTGEVSPTLTTKCNVAVLDVYSVEDEKWSSVKGAPEGAKFIKRSPQTLTDKA